MSNVNMDSKHKYTYSWQNSCEIKLASGGQTLL